MPRRWAGVWTRGLLAPRRRVAALWDRIEGPAVPLTEPWALGIGRFLGAHPRLPRRLRSALGLLDRLGAVSLRPDAIGVDGESVPWDRVTELRLAPAVDVLTVQALEQEYARLTSRLPRIPGRRWVVARAMELVLTLVLAVTGLGLRTGSTAGTEGEPDTEGDRVLSRHVLRSVRHRGRLRDGELEPGVFAALVFVKKPEVTEAAVELARRNGVRVVRAEPVRSHRQAARLRGAAVRIRRRLASGGG